jgi:hypothetical protein
MYIEWTRHLTDPKQKEQFEKTVWGSTQLLNRLKAILEEKEKAIDRSEMSIEVYNTPNWAERQAHKNGNREMIHFLKKLVDLSEQFPPTEDK